MNEGSAADLVERLAAQGYVVARDYFAPALCRALRQETAALATDTTAIDAGVGRGAGHIADDLVRRARIRWLDGATPAQAEFLAAAERLRCEINRHLFMGLFAFEAQFALTPIGGFYARHVDAFRGDRNRVVSLVAYLDDDWTAADGGSLRIWPPRPAGAAADPPAVDIMPSARSLVLMLAEEVPHEVLSCNRPRCSIAGWFRVRNL